MTTTILMRMMMSMTIFCIRTSKVDCVEDSACNNGEINDTCSQVVLLMMLIGDDGDRGNGIQLMILHF